ncbi:MAG: indolepyruvate oxidoreductase subunit beta [Desulfurococcales archaeon]|nr:indolepyruvate oxidoreductase subunit beta [Desulfurococcales archaeon]
MPRRLSILLTGVGGQGIITLASTIAKAALLHGEKALVAETHGLSQRGGSVEVHLRMGNVYSPLIAPGDADVVLGLELIEAARKAHYTSENGIILTADIILRPAVPGVKVPSREELLNAIEEATGRKPLLVPARELALKAGGTIYSNMVMFGALLATGRLEGFVDRSDAEKVIGSLRKSENNLKAFKLGFDYCRSACTS